MKKKKTINAGDSMKVALVSGRDFLKSIIFLVLLIEIGMENSTLSVLFLQQTKQEIKEIIVDLSQEKIKHFHKRD